MKKNKILSVFFQAAISAPGIFPSDATLNENKYPGLQMHYPDPEYPGCIVAIHKDTTVLIPLMNVKSMVLA